MNAGEWPHRARNAFLIVVGLFVLYQTFAKNLSFVNFRASSSFAA
jgi:hypothetical protein